METVPEPTALHFGRSVESADGPVGRLTDVIVDPAERRITHLVVEDSENKARLVPAELLVEGRDPDSPVVLSCRSADVAACPSIRSFSYVGLAGDPQTASAGNDVGVEDVLALPSFGSLGFGDYAGDFGGAYGVTYDSIPAGSAELRRDSIVVSASQEMIGNVEGLRVEGQRLAQVVVHRTRAKDTVAVPIESVVAIDTDCVTVTLPAE
jgi:sporulation protein YlmC with PRC-barrel domain